MYGRNAFALGLVVSLAALSASSGARAAEGGDQKEVCLAAADTGQSLRDDAKYSMARDQFVTCSRDVCPKLVHDQCSEWLRQIDEAIPTVVFGAKDDHGNDVGARVFLDGKPIANTLDHKAVALDPGPHDVRFEHDPGEPVTMHVVVRAGEKNRDVSATLASGEAAPSIVPPDETVAEPATPVGETPSSAPSPHGRTIAAVSLLAGGVVAAGFGLYFGIQAQSDNDRAVTLRAGVPARWTCTSPGPMFQSTCTNLSDARSAHDREMILSETLYIAGGALVAGAAVTWFLWPKRQAEHAGTAWVAPLVGPTQAGLRMGAAF